MSRSKGATLVCCEECGAENLEVEWSKRYGWVCASCETPLNGEEQVDRHRAAGWAEEQLDFPF